MTTDQPFDIGPHSKFKYIACKDSLSPRVLCGHPEISDCLKIKFSASGNHAPTSQ